MVEAMHHHAGTVRLPLTLRHGCAGTSAVETDGAGTKLGQVPDMRALGAKVILTPAPERG